jgi:AraC-like DNA-binding protein
MDMVPEICGDTREETKEETSQNETDLPPEYCHYRDKGCEYARSCLTCPFPQCLYDEPRGRQRWLKELRNKEINKLFSGGWKIKELALLFGVSLRTIQRALKDDTRCK